MLLLLLLLLYHRAPFDHVSLQRWCICHFTLWRMWFCRFLCNYQYRHFRSRCITFFQTFLYFWNWNAKIKLFFFFVLFFWVSNINLDQTLFLSFRSCKCHYCRFWWFSSKEFVFYFVLFPLNRLLVYEGSL